MPRSHQTFVTKLQYERVFVTLDESTDLYLPSLKIIETMIGSRGATASVVLGYTQTYQLTPLSAATCRAKFPATPIEVIKPSQLIEKMGVE